MPAANPKVKQPGIATPSRSEATQSPPILPADSLSETINTLFEKCDWGTARNLLEAECEKRPNEHWLLTRLATTYYEEKEYAKALELAEQARKLAPDCPLVLWECAGALQALQRHEEALHIYSKLIKRKAWEIGEDECGEGWEWGASLLTDVCFRAGVSLQNCGKVTEAIDNFRRHLRLRIEGAESQYDLEDVMRRLSELRRLNAKTPHARPRGLKEELASVNRTLLLSY